MVLIRDIVAPEEGLLYSSDGIQLKIGHKTLSTGTLYITEESLSWKPADQNEGISVLWKNISLHGVSNSPTKNVYVMLDHMLVWPGVYDPGVNQNGGGGGAADAGSDCDEGNESDCEELTEMWFTPTDPNAIDPIFQAMKECQALNPDSADSISDESDFMDAQEDEQEVGQGDMRNLHLEDRFADAEED